MADVGSLRREYMRGGLDRDQLPDDPYVQFERWFTEAVDADLLNPNALVVSTVGADGAPSSRTVLLKYFDAEGFVFYTNYGSRKAREIDGNPQVAALVPWLDFDRQVKIRGRAEKVSTAQSLSYFRSRPRGSQLGAWCSQQSAVIESREALERQFQAMKQRFLDHEIPLPEFWGGYRIRATEIEFWQGRENRLHDRFRYRLAEEGAWQIDRLSP